MENAHSPSDAAFFCTRLGDRLHDIHFDGRVELVSCFDQRVDVFFGRDAINGWSHAGAKELVGHIFADDGVLAATDAKNEVASGDFCIAKQRCASHGVVPVAVEAAEREDSLIGVLIEFLHLDARVEGIGQPDE